MTFASTLCAFFMIPVNGYIYIESTGYADGHWFVWVTQMSHLSMSIGKYKDIPEHDWPSLQMNATCNVEGGLFNDWFTGHLNYQIEHHLFPTMPRHNYAVVSP